MEGIQKLDTSVGPVLAWDTSRWTYAQTKYAMTIPDEWDDVRDLVIYTSINQMDRFDDVAWYFELFGFRVYSFAFANGNKMPLYTREVLQAKHVPSTTAPWVPTEFLAAAIEVIVAEQATGMYPLIPKPFRLWDLANRLGLSGLAFDQRATGHVPGNIPHSLQVLNENAVSIDAQEEFWLAYSSVVPFEPAV